MVKRFFQVVFVLLVLLSLFFSLSPGTGSVPVIWNDKAIHCMSYFLLMMTLDCSWRSGNRLIVKSLFVLIYSSSIEIAQSFIPGREMSIGDVIANSSGIILFLVVVPLFKKFGIYHKFNLV